MKETLLAYEIPPKVVTLVMLLHTGTTAKMVTPDGSSEDFDALAGVLQGGTLASYIFVIVLDCLLRNTISEVGDEVSFTTKHRRSKGYPAEYLTDLDFADDIVLLSDNMEKVQRLLLATEEWALSVGLCISKGKKEY